MGFTNLWKLLQPAPHLPCTLSQAEVAVQYKYWRLRIFYSMYLGYVFYYFTRKCFTFAMPGMIADLGYSSAQVGLLGSVLYITYGLSKFASGVLSDKGNPRYLMSFGLILTALVTILFGLSSSFYLFMLFWGLNGVFQGWGWPACTKQLTYWFSHKERGFWWSLKSTSHNIGGALIPLLVAWVSVVEGWRWSMIVPALLSLVVGLLLIERLRDVPASLGLPPVETYRDDATCPDVAAHKEAEAEELAAAPLTLKQILFQEVLNNKAVWVLALAYFFTYVVRTAVNDWGSLFLHHAKGFSLLEASSCVTWFELGGFVGSIAAGWGSDRFFGGKRVPLMVLCAIGLVGVIAFFWFLAGRSLLLDSGLMALIGFLIFGPQMLVGLAAAEFVDKKAACTANGFAGCFAYIGAAATGYPLGTVIDIWGWQGFFVTLVCCSLAIILILFPLWGVGPLLSKKKKKSLDLGLVAPVVTKSKT